MLFTIFNLNLVCVYVLMTYQLNLFAIKIKEELCDYKNIGFGNFQLFPTFYLNMYMNCQICSKFSMTFKTNELSVYYSQCFEELYYCKTAKQVFPFKIY